MGKYPEVPVVPSPRLCDWPDTGVQRLHIVVKKSTDSCGWAYRQGVPVINTMLYGVGSKESMGLLVDVLFLSGKNDVIVLCPDMEHPIIPIKTECQKHLWITQMWAGDFDLIRVPHGYWQNHRIHNDVFCAEDLVRNAQSNVALITVGTRQSGRTTWAKAQAFPVIDFTDVWLSSGDQPDTDTLYKRSMELADILFRSGNKCVVIDADFTSTCGHRERINLKSIDQRLACVFETADSFEFEPIRLAENFCGLYQIRKPSDQRPKSK